MASVNKDDIASNLKKTFMIKFLDLDSYERFSSLNYEFKEKIRSKLLVSFYIENEDIDSLIKTLKGYKVLSFTDVSLSLEDYFMRFYKNRGEDID